MTDHAAALVWCPFPDASTARVIAGKLLGEGLIACANIIDGMESVFEWQGRIESSSEVGALFKTTSGRLDRVISRLAELHPYEVPAIVGSRCDAAHPDTLSWLSSTVS